MVLSSSGQCGMGGEQGKGIVIIEGCITLCFIKGLLCLPFRNMQGQFWRYVDENWGGSPTFKVIILYYAYIQHFTSPLLLIMPYAVVLVWPPPPLPPFSVFLFLLLLSLLPFFLLPYTAFVKGDRKNKFPSLTVRYKKGASPTLKLLDDTNTVQDTLA